MTLVATLPDIPAGWVAVLVATITGPVVVWVQSRSAKKEARAAKVTAAEAKVTAERVEESIGPKNGHGTVQDATGKVIDQGDQILRELAGMRAAQRALQTTQHAMQTSIDSVVESASTVNQRLKAHDREISELKRRGEG